jgi:hypothetical protein
VGSKLSPHVMARAAGRARERARVQAFIATDSETRQKNENSDKVNLTLSHREIVTNHGRLWLTIGLLLVVLCHIL